jgi:divalent metal cation (Fe/Co/Zn/Cd) transporter
VRDRLLTEVSGVQDVTVHVEPQQQEGGSADQIHAAIQQAAAAHPVAVHEVWIYVDDDGRTRAEAHIGVPPHLTVADAHELVSQIEGDVLEQLPWVYSLHTHIEPAAHELMHGELVAGDKAHPISRAVNEAVATVPGLSRPSNLLVRSTPQGLFLSLDCVANPGLSVSGGHVLAHELSENIRAGLPGVLEVAVRLKPAEPAS